MPTAAKLVGAILFFGIGWVAALFVIDTLPEEMAVTYFPLTIALIGLWQGWMVAGGNAGGGVRASMGQGARTSVQIAFFGLLLFALREMFRRAANLRYDDPGAAVIATLELVLEYFIQSLTIPIWGTLLIGGVIAGALVEIASKLWK
ncbi:Tellurite resistance protein TrgA [Roseibacterium elongatum DSM 19469]|uniref:Tellurite resistance protein TrgA n=1 Tax=Roseicyclus elongatus DSM 19469 TaxID=1294273 RepID=W8SRB2_9RHOB|nr:TrgA family protein [Roseibacterium elongatum]AHM05065.1 Tellurite resistance protein TrgA [Roseibacterium elongatum DSM 19469]